MSKQLKLCCTGTSGSGKTTLSKIIAGLTGIEFIPSSVGLIMNEEQKAILRSRFNYDNIGHKNVINLSSSDPLFGKTFQMIALSNRSDLIEKKASFIMDRSPIDNVTYMLTQCSHNMSEMEIESFIRLAQRAYVKLDGVIYIKPCQPGGKIEDNQSRVANKYYQSMVDSVFQMVYDTYFSKLQVLTHIIDFWGLEEREFEALRFIEVVEEIKG